MLRGQTYTFTVTNIGECPDERAKPYFSKLQVTEQRARPNMDINLHDVCIYKTNVSYIYKGTFMKTT